MGIRGEETRKEVIRRRLLQFSEPILTVEKVVVSCDLTVRWRRIIEGTIRFSSGCFLLFSRDAEEIVLLVDF